MKRAFLFVFILVSMCLVSCTKSDTGTEKPSSAETAGMAPDFVLKDIEGKDIQLSRYKGNVVVLEFWATWCPPCKATIPELIALQKKYAGKGLVVLGVSLDEGGDLTSKLSAFSRENKINYSILIGSEEVSRAYGVMSIPETVLIGRGNKIITTYKGYVDNLEALISQQIDKNI